MSKKIKTGGMQKGFKYKKSRIWINDGKNESLIWIDECIPNGWIHGRLKNVRPAWNKGLTKENNAGLKKMSNTLKSMKPRYKYSDEYLIENFILNNKFKNYWDTHGYVDCCKYFNLSENVIKRIIKLANLESPKQHQVKIQKYIYTDEWRLHQSEILKGKNIWSKNSKHSKSQIEKQKQSYKNKTELEKKLSKEKEYNTRMKNGSYKKHITKAELEAKTLLLKYFDESDICYQYFDIYNYPYNCDFYIKSQKLFIEINAYPSHGGHRYTGSDSDLIRLKSWNEKIKEGKKQYNNWIYTWTDLDLRKFAIAERNKLNYFVAYTKKDLEEYLNENFKN